MNFFLKIAAILSALLSFKLYFRTYERDFNPLAVAVQIPLLGGCFVEAHLEALLKDRKWIEALQVAESSMQAAIPNKSYIVWYYKGMAECATYQFSKCEESAVEASFKAPKYFVNQLLVIAKTFKNKEEKQHIKKQAGDDLSEC